MARYSVGRRRALALLTLTSLMLVILDRSDSALTHNVRSLGATVLSPLRSVGRSVARPVENGWHGIFDYDDLEDENRRLRRELEAARGNEAVFEAHLRQYLALAREKELTWFGDFDVETAQVLSEAVSQFEQTIEIDVGTQEGIQLGMPVITNCLVGKITQANRRTSIVRLVTDEQYTIAASAYNIPNGEVITGVELPPVPTTRPPVTIASNTTNPVTTAPPSTAAPSTALPTTVPPTTAALTTAPPTSRALPDYPALESGHLDGRGAGKLPILTLVQNDEQGSLVQRGAIVATNGANSSISPAGIPIGYVINRIERPEESGPIVEVQPCADLENLTFVAVIRYLPFG